ncbi:4-hydroxybenzoate polyprenyltransferase [Sanguibacter gelidistatuariae]|uniref:4-hydroxybenzoate polyprenyltransferase n=1 Tax=Sanguibacter gelidistatuariae TaxID=1814289 RepID=A0A1G6J8F0_9MICO|nr:UbiA family prenyltransferase [Sanguibacter gelidistatuariae]SDC14981.1 4-hydroxybenzoate polyprenyltransferase [Sanguibacter gelidistatuariae]
MASPATLLVRSAHPGPTAAVTVLAVVLGVGVGLPAGTLVLLALAILAGQLSIGWSNDWIDAERDTAVGRTDKPVAQGLLDAGAVRTAALAAAGATVVLSFALGLAAGAVHVVLVASGWSYNAGLKRTPFSVVPFMVSFGLLPAVVTLALPDPAPPAAWAVVVGAVLGIAIHFTNVLPDLADDAATGVAGLPHRVGRRVSGLVAFGALALAAVVAGVGPALGQGGIPVITVVGVLAAVSIAVWGAVLVLTRPPGRLLFQLIIVASLLLATQLALSGTRLVAELGP